MTRRSKHCSSALHSSSFLPSTEAFFHTLYDGDLLLSAPISHISDSIEVVLFQAPKPPIKTGFTVLVLSTIFLKHSSVQVQNRLHQRKGRGTHVNLSCVGPYPSMGQIVTHPTIGPDPPSARVVCWGLTRSPPMLGTCITLKIQCEMA